MTTFDEVLDGWRKAKVEDIHPLRRISEQDYWDSGRAQAVDAARHIPAQGRVMDFGAGEGRLTIPFAELGYEVVAVDASQEMLDRLEANAKRFKVKGIETVLTDGKSLSFRKKFDTIVTRAVLIHHSHEDVADLVKLLAGQLRKGGHLVADWPLGPMYERQNWTDVTTWEPEHRRLIAEDAGLELIEDATPSVWRKV